MNARDERILRHIGLYRLSLRATLSRCFFHGGNPGNVIQRLRQDGYIQERRGLHGRLSYYQLTPKGATAVVVSPKRAKVLGTQAVHTHLGVLWFCCMSHVQRQRLERAQVDQLFPDEVADGPFPPHCLESGARYRLYRVFVVGPNAETANFVGRLRRYLSEILEKPAMARWVRSRQFAFALVTENREKLMAIRDATKRAKLQGLAHFELAIAPGHRTIGAALDEFKNK